MSTIENYIQIKNERPEPFNGYFWAFDKKQYADGIERLVYNGTLTDDKLYRAAGFVGLYGTEKGLEYVANFELDQNRRIREQCDAQDVYDYEYVQHGCDISFDGDREALDIVMLIYGEAVAGNIRRRHI